MVVLDVAAVAFVLFWSFPKLFRSFFLDYLQLTDRATRVAATFQADASNELYSNRSSLIRKCEIQNDLVNHSPMGITYFRVN